ncbi:MAG: hypothetical protein ABIQ31_22905 [Ferruginibacter sp.]
MKPLIILTGSFVIAVFVTRIITGNYEVELSARIAMAVMLVFTAIGHFFFTKGMVMMLPGFIPFKKAVVYITGLLEIIAAAGLLVPATKTLTGWFLILFFLLLLPANINAAIRQIDYQKGTRDGNGIGYLWFRVPLQILFILWVYFSAIHF